MAFVDNDRWAGRFPLTRNRRYLYTIEAWRDLFESWRAEVMQEARRRAGRRARADRGAHCSSSARSSGQGRRPEGAAARCWRSSSAQARRPGAGSLQIMLGEDVRALMAAGRHRAPTLRATGTSSRSSSTGRPPRFAAWYEMFPRSQSGDPARHGTFDDVIRRLPYVRDMGFDVLYFPPIHPIGRTNRKGRNNTLTPRPDDPGSPYAIGAAEGGHDALHPELGTLRGLSPAGRGGARARPGDRARLRDPVLARPSLDQASIRNGSTGAPTARIKYAENPPKKYEDIVNVHFYRDALPCDLVRAARRRAVLGRAGRAGSSASTIRTPSRCRSGNG